MSRRINSLELNPVLKYFANLIIAFLKASHIKSFVHGHPPASQKYFLFYRMKFGYCLQTKEKKTLINNFYFLVLDYLESWLNLIIVSMFVLENRQVRDLRNREPQTRWLSVNATLDTRSLNFLSTESKYFKIWLKTYPTKQRKSSTSLSYIKFSTENNSKGYY